MRHSRAVATWLLEQLRIDIGLAGDLLEEQENGRSAIWYWRQVLIAVAVNIWGDIRSHKVVMLGAVMTGIGAETVLWGLLHAFVSSWLPLRPMTSFAPWTINLLILFVTQIATGWLIARTHRTHPMPSLLTFLASSLTWWAYQNFSLIRRLAVDSIDQPRFRIYLFYHLSNLFVATFSLLVGALLSSSPKLPAVDERAEN
jgi:hypothetical protein